jgi:hypothetical protein
VSGSFFGFEGLTEFDRAFPVFAGTNGVNGELEPPDQALAVGNGFVLESVNDAIAAYDTSGHILAAEALNPFFEQAPQATIDPATGAILSFGPFISDPRILFGASTGRFFVSVVEIDLDPVTGNFGLKSHFYSLFRWMPIPFTASMFSRSTRRTTGTRALALGISPRRY